MDLLQEAAIFLAAAVIAVPICRLLGFGSVPGYLVAGVAIGPDGLALITDVDNILHFAEIGIVLLLFVIGLELKPSRLWVLRRSVFGQGAAQVAACAVPIGLVGWFLGLDPVAATVVGAGLALSSTAFVLQLLAERGQLTSQHGRTGFAILLFQDLAVVPLLAAMPLLETGGSGFTLESLLRDGGAVVGVLLALVIGGHFALRPILRLVARERTREIFTATALLVVVGSALAVSTVGVSMALGAFVAGVLLAESEFRHELEVTVEPFRGLFLGLFFIAVGMSADLDLIGAQPLTVLGLAAGLIAVKGTVILALARVWGLERRAAPALAAILAQGGEFAFVLFSAAVARGLLADAVADLLIAVVTLSMAATPLLVLFTERVLVPRLAHEAARAYDDIADDGEEAPVLIAGFGRFGQIIGRMLHMAHVPFTAIEVNPSQVDFVRRYGHRVYYGDPSRADLLRAAGAGRARAIVLAVDDVEASVRAAENIRRHFPDVPIYARARNRQHAHRLMDIGVRVIVRETFDSSLNLGEQLLVGLGWPVGRAQEAAHAFRAHDEGTLARQYALRHDEQALIQSSHEAAAELEELFELDEPSRPRPARPAHDEG